LARWFIRTLLAAPLVLALVLAGCGDGSDDSGDETATVTTTAPAGVTTAPDAPVLPSPGPVDDESIVLTVAGGDSLYQPTRAQFDELPTISAGGAEGVSLAVLASQVGIEGDAVVTVEGRSKDLSVTRFWRGTLAEAGDDLVVSIDSDGLIRLGGSLIPEEAWLYAVESVSFQ
jgi:hypothetical protein